MTRHASADAQLGPAARRAPQAVAASKVRWYAHTARYVAAHADAATHGQQGRLASGRAAGRIGLVVRVRSPAPDIVCALEA